jgi:hypothetical protein
MSAGVVTELAEALKIAVSSTQLEIVGALRNVLASVGNDACIEYLNAGGLSLLLAVVFNVAQQAQVQLSDPSYNERKQEDLSQMPMKIELENGSSQTDNQDSKNIDYSLFLEQILACLCSLGESTNDAINQMSTVSMTTLLLELMSGDKVPMSLRIVAGKFMNILTDDNDAVVALFSDRNEFVQFLVNLTKDSAINCHDANMELLVLTSSVLHNIKAVFDEPYLNELYKGVIELLKVVLSYDVAEKYPQVESVAISIHKVFLFYLGSRK